MDITFHKKKTRFNYRVGAIIIQNGSLLCVKNKNADYYYSVGGRVKINETSLDALHREVFEETGLKLEVSRLVLIHENFFTEERTHEQFHEISFYFEMEGPFSNSDIVSKSHTELGEAEELVSLSIHQLDKIKLYPEVLKEVILHPQPGIKHMITYQ